MPDGLDIQAIFDELGDLKNRFGPRFIIGLSGGGDSLALTHMCAYWAKQSGADISALCIDHGFRPASQTEANQARDWAMAFGLKAWTYINTSSAPKTGLQEFARALRHRVFAQAAMEVGGATVLLGHTLDDQAETIAFRLARQTGLDGLAGMARVTRDVLRYQGQRFPIARPLLSVRRQALRDYLRQNDLGWIEDPSNENSDFARIKIRKRLHILGGHERLARIGASARVLRDHLDACADAFLTSHLMDKHKSVQCFNISAFHRLAPCVQKRVLYRQMSHIIGASIHISPLKQDRIVHAISQVNFTRTTLAGILISRQKEMLWMSPAPPRHNHGKVAKL